MLRNSFYFNTVLSRDVRSLFGPTRKSSPWGNFSDGGLDQSINQALKFILNLLVDWLIDDKLTLTWLVYWIRTTRSVFAGAGLKWPNTAGQYSTPAPQNFACKTPLAKANSRLFVLVALAIDSNRETTRKLSRAQYTEVSCEISTMRDRFMKSEEKSAEM